MQKGASVSDKFALSKWSSDGYLTYHLFKKKDYQYSYLEVKLNVSIKLAKSQHDVPLITKQNHICNKWGTISYHRNTNCLSI